MKPAPYSRFKLFGMTMFDLYDYLTSNLLMPVGGLFICIFVGWVWGEEKVRGVLSNEGILENSAIISVFMFLVRYVAPVTISIILLRGLKIL